MRRYWAIHSLHGFHADRQSVVAVRRTLHRRHDHLHPRQPDGDLDYLSPQVHAHSHQLLHPQPGHLRLPDQRVRDAVEADRVHGELYVADGGRQGAVSGALLPPARLRVRQCLHASGHIH